ncbi:MAG TPA: LuxR C-terminal-related transcriptional regulator, partial [Rubrivivax sp.]|nr:LuxR C-terminal-related transcriptional regulator [Rubrivivax sp.]
QTGEVLAGVLAMLRHATGPTVLVVDDAQWADSATLDLLRYVSRRIEGTRALLILSHRDDALASDHPLLGVLAGLPTSRALRIVLPPLTADGVAELASRARRSAHGLYGVTQGNPFFVTELLACAAQASQASHAAPDAQSLPASVRDAVLARIAPLPAAARDVIEIVSVSPTPLEVAVLESVVDDATTAIALCTAAGLLLQVGSSLRFRHELARRAVEAALPPARAGALHAAVFDALSLRGGAALTRLVHHAAQAGLPGAVCQLAPDAARAAAQVGAHRQAAALYALALEHAANLPPTERAALHVAHSLECQHIQRTDDALVSRSAALALHRQLGDRVAEGRDLYELALIQHYREGQAAAMPLAQQAIDVLQRTDAPLELASAYAVIGNLHLTDGSTVAAARWSEKALSLIDGLAGADECRAYALNTLAKSQLRLSDSAQAWQQLECSLAIALRLGQDSHVAAAYLQTATFSLLHRRYPVALQACQQGLAYCEARDLDIYRLPFQIRLGHVLLETGQWDAADAQVLAMQQSAALHAVDAQQLANLQGLIDLRRGRTRSDGYWDALVHGEGALEVGLWHAPLPVACCEAAWLRGDDAAVRHIASRALPQAVGCGERWRIGQLACWLRRAGGDPRPVLHDLASLPQPCRLELDGDQRAAAHAWADLGCTYQQALVLLQGDVEELQQALPLLDALGALPAARVARRRLRAVGVRRVPRGHNTVTRVDPLGLTAREREVLEMLAQRLSNGEIAARLHRSDRTVENHVATLLAKLGASNRQDAVLRAGLALKN